MGKKLLVADDSLTIQKVIKLALSHDGYDIQTVADGNELMAQLSLFRPDVLLIDLGLPGKSAFEVKKELNSTSDLKDVPCVLMASAFEKVDEAKVGLLGFDGRLTKPFDPSHLREVLQKAIDSRSLPTDFDPAKLPPPPKKKDGLPAFAPLPSFDTESSSGEAPISLNDPLWTDEAQSPLGEGTSLPPTPEDTGFIMPESVEESGEAPSLASIYETDDKTDEVDLGQATSTGIPPLAGGDDTDIRHLTESTVRMSGLDDLDGWNINETAKASIPSIPSIFETGRSEPVSPALPRPPTPRPGGTVASPPPPPTPSATSTPAPAFPMPSVSRVEDALADLPTSKEIEEMVEKQVRAQLEEMIQQQVSVHLEKFVKNSLPDLAERIVKAEIRKLLEGLA